MIKYLAGNSNYIPLFWDYPSCLVNYMTQVIGHEIPAYSQYLLFTIINIVGVTLVYMILHPPWVDSLVAFSHIQQSYYVVASNLL